MAFNGAILNKGMKIRRNILLVTLYSLILVSCKRDPIAVDVSDIKVDATAKRFEKELFKNSGTGQMPDIKSLKQHYGSFFNVFTHQIISVPEGPDEIVGNHLSQFINDAEVKDVYRMTDSAYSNMEDVEKRMTGFLQHLNYYYPDVPVPGVVTYISAFNYAVITTDSVIGIGLDMFLGDDVFYYARLGIPKYMFSKFRREYIVPSAIKAWYQSEYDIAGVKNELLSQMIYQGKLMYFSKSMSPELNDTLITGFTAAQLEWCKQNEANVWAYLIENKLLFNTDPSIYAKFVNDGPSTSGLPKEAPGKIGAWIGWQIVSQYAEKNSDISLPEIIKEIDAQKILEKSGYKPNK